MIGLGLFFLGSKARAQPVAESGSLAPPETDLESCNATPNAEHAAAAVQARGAGRAASDAGDLAAAIRAWQEAYVLDCSEPAILMDLAGAMEQFGSPGRAAITLRLFNRRAPGSAAMEANFTRIDRLEDQAREMEREQERRRQQAVRDRAAQASRPPRLANHERRAESRKQSFWPAGVIGAGTAAALSGAVIYVEARVAANDAAATCGEGSRARCESFEAVLLGERARSRAVTGAWLGLSGAGVASLGILWALLADSGPAQPLAKRGWDTQTRADGASVTYTSRF